MVSFGTKQQRKGRVDPVLKLHTGCPLMFTENSDVLNGQANGSRVRLEKIWLHPGERTFPVTLHCGAVVNGAMASQISCLEVKHVNPDMKPSRFDVEPQSFTFTVDMPIPGTFESETVRMKGKQFPLISNCATTGHKLQGCAVNNILVNEWHCKVNWAHVVLSRVRTMKGLCLRVPLSDDLEKCEMKQEMKGMLAEFEHELTLGVIEESERQQWIQAESQ